LHSLADISLARERLGYSPVTGIEEGLKSYISWARQEVQAGKV